MMNCYYLFNKKKRQVLFSLSVRKVSKKRLRVLLEHLFSATRLSVRYGHKVASNVIRASRFFADNYKSKPNVIFDEPPVQQIEKPLQKKRARAKEFANKKPAATNNASKKRQRIPQPQRERIWRNAFGGALDGICSVCRYNRISAFSFAAGHIQSVNKGGPTEDWNLTPICSTCNSSMGDENLHDFCARIWGSTVS
jgi:hypothetical protein